MKLDHAHFRDAIRDYRTGTFTYHQLAKKHGVSPATICLWIRRAGLQPPPRGRPPFEKPTATHQKIIQIASTLTGEEIAQKLGVSRQRVNKVLHRWQQFRPPPLSRRSDQSRPKAPRVGTKDQVICFRITTPVVERVQAILHALGLRRRQSNNEACRAVLLMALERGGPGWGSSSESRPVSPAGFPRDICS
jgi:transposase